ncbi:Exocyst complex component EXO84C, partial [Cucurbita argyrosperma subsp. argyrosperma]
MPSQLLFFARHPYVPPCVSAGSVLPLILAVRAAFLSLIHPALLLARSVSNLIWTSLPIRCEILPLYQARIRVDQLKGVLVQWPPPELFVSHTATWTVGAHCELLRWVSWLTIILMILVVTRPRILGHIGFASNSPVVGGVMICYRLPALSPKWIHARARHWWLFPLDSQPPHPTYLCRIFGRIWAHFSLATKESASIFGDDPIYTNRVVQWAECEIEFFVRLVKENAPSSETVSALRAASICIHASLNYCSLLETQGLKLSKLLLVLLRSFMEEVLELNFRRARRGILDLAEPDDNFVLSSRFASPLSPFLTSLDSLLVVSGMKFMHIVDDILEQLTSSAVFHFGGNVLNRISQLFDKYMDALRKALPGPSDDENLTELKEPTPFRVETDSEKLAILGIAFTIMDELLPDAVMTVWKRQDELVQKNESTETVVYNSGSSVELKDWKRHLQVSFDKLRDHFCRQYVLGFIYSREGKTRLDAWIYLSGDGQQDLHWGSNPHPSLPFQALFAKLQQLAIVAGDVLLGKEKIQKILLARLTETFLIWLSDDQEFWGVFEDDSVDLLPVGLQQLILDMHFTVEIARFAGYPSRQIHQIASAIIARAIRTFSDRGIDPQSALPEDEWFLETAKSAISKLLGADGSDSSEIDDDHIILHHDDDSDSDDTTSSLSTLESTESFASASMGELESPSDLTDSEN